MRKKNGKRVILAVDLTAKDTALALQSWEAVRLWMGGDAAIIEPVSILNRHDAAIAQSLKNQIGGLREAAERHLADRLATMGLKNIAAPKILFADGSSTQRAVAALIAHAKKTRCDLIAVSSHSRTGIKRWALGSFAEALTLQSPIPLLVVNPKQSAAAGKGKTILYSTDFSTESKKGLSLVCRAFKDSKPKIVLFHSYLFPVQIYLEPFASSPPSQALIKAGIEKIEKMGKSWSAELQKNGFSCEFVMNKKTPFVADGILSAIKSEKVGLVAMVSKSGKLGAAVLGSATREVLRNSPRPVWVVHPN